MMKRFFMVGLCAFVCGNAVPASAKEECESWSTGYSIAAVTEQGQHIKLNDETNWRVDIKDAAKALNWPPNAPIDLCGENKLTNTAEGESVRVRPLQ